MGGHLMYKLFLVCILAALCSCRRDDCSSKLEEQMVEIKELLDVYMEKVDAAENNKNCEEFGRPGPPGTTGAQGSPGPAGRDGRDGPVGAAGPNGRDGVAGPAGPRGPAGADGTAGPAGPKGESGKLGAGGEFVPPGPNQEGHKQEGPKQGSGGSGAIFTRWGKTKCGPHSTLIYDGFVGMSRYEYHGGGVNYQCMPFKPEYNWRGNGLSLTGVIAGTEYETYKYGVFDNNMHDQNAPCAVCHAGDRSSALMIPAKRTCPSPAWQKEYEGYLMSQYYRHNHQSTFECVDAHPEAVPGTSSNTNGALFYFNIAICSAGGIDCSPYDATSPITCVVCTI